MITYILFFTFLICAIGTTLVISHPNDFIGIRIRYTQEYPEIWEKVHKLASLLYLVFLIIIIVVFVVTNSSARIISVIAGLLIPNVASLSYAAALGRRADIDEDIQQNLERKRAEESENQITISKFH